MWSGDSCACAVQTLTRTASKHASIAGGGTNAGLKRLRWACGTCRGVGCRRLKGAGRARQANGVARWCAHTAQKEPRSAARRAWRARAASVDKLKGASGARATHAIAGERGRGHLFLARSANGGGDTRRVAARSGVARAAQIAERVAVCRPRTGSACHIRGAVAGAREVLASSALVTRCASLLAFQRRESALSAGAAHAIGGG